jgi:hypothetical protein
MLGFGLYQIMITQDGNFVATEASLLEAYSKTHTPFTARSDIKSKRVIISSTNIPFKNKIYTSESIYACQSHQIFRSGAVLRARKAGTRFTIYVNPKKPAYAVVQKGQPYFIYVLALTGLLGAMNYLP